MTDIPVSHPNHDAQRLAVERAEVGAKILKVLEDMRDNADMQIGALVGNTAAIEAGIADMNERDQNKEKLLRSIDGNLLRLKTEFLRVFEVGMENGSTVGNHSILSQMRHCLRIVMEAVEGHPGIVVGQDFRESAPNLDSVNGFFTHTEPVRQTGGARPAAEATLQDEKAAATPEQVAELEKQQRGDKPVTCCGSVGKPHGVTAMTPMPNGWVCPICNTPWAYIPGELPDASRLVQEEAADARRVHDNERSNAAGESAQNRKLVEQIEAQMAGVYGPSNARVSTTYRDGLWSGLNTALNILKGDTL